MRSKRKRLLPTSSASPRLIWNVVWMWLSTSPGVTTLPRAEITRCAGWSRAMSSVLPTATSRPSATAQALDRVGLQDPLAVGLPEAPVRVARLDPAERHRVHRDVGAPELARERAREGEHAPARRRRDAELRLADACRVAGDVDDPAELALDHPRGDRVAAVEHAVEADVDLLGPFLGPGLEEELPADHARIVDEDVDRAELRRDALGHAPDGRVVRHVGVDGERAAPALADLRRGRLRLVPRLRVVHGDRGALAPEHQRDLATH